MFWPNKRLVTTHRMVNMVNMVNMVTVIQEKAMTPLPSAGALRSKLFPPSLCIFTFSRSRLNPSCSHPALFPRTQEDEEQHNRISRFKDVPGSPAETLATELVILTSATKYNQLHSSGWLGFKPSAYRSPVRL